MQRCTSRIQTEICEIEDSLTRRLFSFLLDEIASLDARVNELEQELEGDKYAVLRSKESLPAEVPYQES